MIALERHSLHPSPPQHHWDTKNSIFVQAHIKV
jgi:hypothetical protein